MHCGSSGVETPREFAKTVISETGTFLLFILQTMSSHRRHRNGRNRRSSLPDDDRSHRKRHKTKDKAARSRTPAPRPKTSSKSTQKSSAESSRKSSAERSSSKSKKRIKRFKSPDLALIVEHDSTRHSDHIEGLNRPILEPWSSVQPVHVRNRSQSDPHRPTLRPEYRSNPNRNLNRNRLHSLRHKAPPPSPQHKSKTSSKSKSKLKSKSKGRAHRKQLKPMPIDSLNLHRDYRFRHQSPTRPTNLPSPLHIVHSAEIPPRFCRHPAETPL